MKQRKVLIWENREFVGGGQKMSLLVADMLCQWGKVEFIISGKGALADELDARGIPYVIVALPQLSSHRKSLVDDIKYLFFTPRIIHTACRIVTEKKADLLYVPGPTVLPLGAMVGQITDTPVIWHLHHMFKDAKTLRLLNISSRMKAVKCILAVSNVVGAQITDRLGMSKCRTLYNPVDMTIYHPGCKPKEVMDEFGLDEKDMVLEHIGFLMEQKRQDISIRALKWLRDLGYSAKLMLIGDSKPGDMSYKEHLIALAEKLGITNHVIFAGYRNDVQKLLRVAAVVIVVMSEEGLPLAGLEAMAECIPLAVVNNGGAAELVKTAESGLLFDGDKDITENCAKIVKRLLDEPELRKKLGENGYQFTKSRNLSHYVEIIQEIFEEAIK